MSHVQVTYDGLQHCMAVQDTNHKTVAIDCPATGKGEEFFPSGLVGAGLGGCMLLSIGAVANRHGIDLTGAAVDVDIAMTDKPEAHISEVDVRVTMPQDFIKKDRRMLESAADACAIKHSFRPDTRIRTHFHYPVPTR